MINQKGERELVYIVKIDDIKPIPAADRVELAYVCNWQVMVRKNQFHIGDYAIYFEIDSKVPEKEPFLFLADKHFKIKTQKYFKGTVISQGLLMSLDDFEMKDETPSWLISIKSRIANNKEVLHEGLTNVIGVTYSTEEDNYRKSVPRKVNVYARMTQMHPFIFKHKLSKWLMTKNFGKKILFVFFGRTTKKSSKTSFPTKFPFIHKTDQERCENIPNILDTDAPFIRTEKCDGSSATYILERKSFNRFEFYVCSRNVRMLNEGQECFYSQNYYWDMAKKYDIEHKLKMYLKSAPTVQYVCWQGEICGPNIQKNPHHLTDYHLFCFHMIDSEKGKWDIRDAKVVWNSFHMESVPIQKDYIYLNSYFDFEEFKRSADGYYNASVCEGNKNCPREGFVYYNANNPNISFKNVSREYLLKHNS